MKTLIWRMIKKSWGVQLAVTLLLATGVAVLVIYASYMEREVGVMNKRIKNITPPGFFLATEAQPQLNRDVNAQPFVRTFRFLASWYQANTPTNLGNLPITYVDLTYGDRSFAPVPGVAAVHSRLANRLGLSVGDTITLSKAGGPFSVEVTHIFEETPFDFGVDFGESIVVRTGEAQRNKYFLYARTAGSQITDSQIISSINFQARHTNVVAAHEQNAMGKLMVQSNYAVISQAKLTLLLFLCLAFLTAKLLGYLDNRRMLAILKSLGLKQGQMAAVMSAESLVTPLAGAVLGGVLSLVILRTLNETGHNMSMSLRLVLSAVFSVLPAILLGVFVPARLAQVSTVNELLFERPAAMFRERTDSLRKRHPGLEPLTSQGVHFLRLESAEGVFQGLVFRKLGDQVQAGEVLALEQCWWGLKTKEYVSPVKGTVVYFEPQTGIIGIGPEDLLETMAPLPMQPIATLVTQHNDHS